ncbi:MAG: hypothetical protein NTV92_02485 [Candidatus Bipolaricaulota bacterium]|nr:hypothetical protein [Candidatus Bipolaricaulota bacterium]
MRGGIAVLVGLLGLALAAQAVPLCDYRSPLTDLSNLVMSFSYEYVNDPYGAKERDVNAGRFVVDYKRLYDTAEYGFDVGVANQLDISLLDVSSYSTVADGNYKRYLTSDGDAFAFAGASVRSSSSYSSLGVSVDLGLGLGRFNDVTPLAIATRIDEDLVRRGRLTDHLRAADLQILAYEIGSRQTYLSLGDLLSVVQEIIESSGFVRPGGLDALDLSKITNLLQDEGFTRYCGWDGTTRFSTPPAARTTCSLLRRSTTRLRPDRMSSFSWAAASPGRRASSPPTASTWTPSTTTSSRSF